MIKSIFSFTLIPSVVLAAPGGAAGVNVGVWDSIASASLVVQLVLAALLGMSIVSWSIIISKWRYFKNIRGVNETFLTFFWKAGSLDEVYSRLAEFPRCPIANMFRAGFTELQRIADASVAGSTPTNHAGVVQAPKLVGLDNLNRALRKSLDIEVSGMERRLGFLATTGSTGPFIGLFGTVWGIMNAFQKIGATGQAQLAVVAPGISEALIATAIGLAAAIPAVVGYNHFVTKLKREELEMSNFCSDFLNISKLNFFKDDSTWR